MHGCGECEVKMAGSNGAVASIAAFCHDAAMRGWHERNGGNVSVWLGAAEAEAAADEFARMGEGACVGGAVSGLRRFPLAWPIPELDGAFFLVTATGCFMRNVAGRPGESLGLIRIVEAGASYEVVAGFSSGGRATSELASHLLVHLERARTRGAAGPEGLAGASVVYHAHTPSLIALSHVVAPETAHFTRALWSTFTECPMFCPAGVGVVGFLIPGSLELARTTAELARHHDAIMWASHGVLVCSPSLDEAYGLVETLEKAADIALRTMACGAASDPGSTVACGAASGFGHGLGAEELVALDEALGLGLDRSLLA